MPRPRIAASTALAFCIASSIVLSACGEPEPAADGQASTEAPLPGPRRTDGAVTDMPAAPGPGEVPLAGSAPPSPPEIVPADGIAGLPPLEQNPEAGLPAPSPAGTFEAPPVPPTPPSAAPEDPRDVMRAYYAAINARDFATAQATWADDAGAGQTAAQLAAGFADAASVELTVGEPRPVEGATGTLYVEVPVTVTTTRADGGVQHQAGRYTLRRSQVDGASAAQRAWRIAAMDLRDAAR